MDGLRMVIFCAKLLLFAADLSVVWSQSYTYHTPSDVDGYWWPQAKEFCECTGHLAILDTEDKQMALLNQVTIPSGKCAWIGASTWTDDKQYRWIELPPNYDKPEINGELLNTTYSNFLSGDPIHEDRWAVCIDSNGTWHGSEYFHEKHPICEWTVCGPGLYKGRKEASNNFCPGGVEACVPCSHDQIKSVSGDYPALCLNVCDGITNVPNAERTACVCSTGYYTNGSSCLMCTGNTIKKTSGNTSYCDADAACDGMTTMPNENHTACVCSPGFYEEGNTCLPCLKLLSGSGVENLTDGDTNTCSPVPFQNKKEFHQYLLDVENHCVKPEINLAVATDNTTTCYDVRGAIFTKKPLSGCGDNVFNACSVMDDNLSLHGKRVCSLKCKCAESVDQCLIHTFSVVARKDMRICEIRPDKIF